MPGCKPHALTYQQTHHAGCLQHLRESQHDTADLLTEISAKSEQLKEHAAEHSVWLQLV